MRCEFRLNPSVLSPDTPDPSASTNPIHRNGVDHDADGPSKNRTVIKGNHFALMHCSFHVNASQ